MDKCMCLDTIQALGWALRIRHTCTCMEQHQRHADHLQRLAQDPDFATFDCAFDTAERSSPPAPLGHSTYSLVIYGERGVTMNDEEDMLPGHADLVGHLAKHKEERVTINVAQTSADHGVEFDARQGQTRTGQGEHDPDVATLEFDLDTGECSSPAMPSDDASSFLLIDRSERQGVCVDTCRVAERLRVLPPSSLSSCSLQHRSTSTSTLLTRVLTHLHARR